MRTAHVDSPGPAALLRIGLLGTPRFLVGDEPWRFSAPPKALSLLAYLIVRRDKLVARQTAAFALWPDEDEPAARANLRRHLHYLQAAFPQAAEENPWILIQGRSSLQWNPRARCSVDVDNFERLSRCDESLEEAIEIYAGDLLQDIADDALESDRRRLRELQAANLDKLVASNRRDHKLGVALAFAQRLLALDPWREDVVRTIMELRYAIGDRAGAIAEYQRFAERSMLELDAFPMPETQACHDAIVRETLVLHQARGAPAFLVPDVPGEVQPALPFSGRETELARLHAQWKRAAQGCGTLVLLAGEAGIGKTRLVNEFARVAESEGARVLRGCAAFNDPVPYEPLISAVRDALPMVTSAQIDRVFLAALAPLIPELRQRASGIDQLPELEPARERQRLFEAYVRVIASLSVQRPVLLVLEDLHWSGSASIDLLGYLCEQTADKHVAIVATYRVEDTARSHPLIKFRRLVARDPEPVHLTLTPFSRQCVSDLVDRLSKDEQTLRGHAQMLYERSQGSPLFLTELIWGIRDRSGGVGVDHALTSGLQGIVEERLARLSDDARCLAEMAAIAGSPFDIELLRELTSWDEERSITGLNELLDRHVVRAATQTQIGAYAFSHQLIESAVYERAERRQIAHWHQRAAVVMEELYGDRIDDFAQRIGSQFERSSTPKRAAPYYERCAVAALAVFAYDDAVAFANKGLAVVQDMSLRIRLLLDRERAHERLGRGHARTADIDEVSVAVQHCDDTGLRAEVLIRRVEYYHVRSEREAEATAISQLKSLARAAKSPGLETKALYAEGRLFTLVGRYDEAQTAYLQALDLAIQAGDLRSQIETRCLLADVHERRGEFELCAEQLTIARDQSSHLEDPARALPILYAMSRLLNHQKKGAQLVAVAEEMLEIASLVGDRYFEATAYNLKAIVASNWFRIAESELYFDRAFQLFEAMLHQQGMIAVLNNRAVVAMRLGDAARAFDLYRSVRDRAIQTNAPLFLEVAEMGCSAACLRGGDPSQALLHARAALELTARTNSQNCGMAFDALGQAEMEAGDYAGAQEHFSQAIALMGAPEFEALVTDVFANLALAQLSAGRNAEALANIERIMPSVLQRGDDMEEPERLYHIAAQVYRANGKEDTARGNACRAFEIFSERLASIDDRAARESYAAIGFHRQIAGAYQAGGIDASRTIRTLS